MNESLNPVKPAGRFVEDRIAISTSFQSNAML